MKIDVHAHYYPPALLNELRPIVDRDTSLGGADAQRMLALAAVNPQASSLDARLSGMERLGITRDVLSLALPSVSYPDAAAARSVLQTANDIYSDVAKQHPALFRVFAALPVQYPEEALRELERVGDRPEVKGVIMSANLAGRPLPLQPLEPLFAELERRGLVFFLHPFGAPGMECLQDYSLANLAGYLFDTTLAVLRLVFAGVFERHPDLQLIFPHMGGVAPYMLGRIEWGYHRFEPCRANITAPPETFFRRFYYDTVSRSAPAMQMLIDMWGADRVLYGTDVPFREDIAEQEAAIEALRLDPAAKQGIYFDNAARLLSWPA